MELQRGPLHCIDPKGYSSIEISDERSAFSGIDFRFGRDADR
jgi:hypothetical protein